VIAVNRRSRRIWGKAKTTRFRRLLLAWYRAHGRDLPWRTAASPYEIWVSEIMLQQTQVRTALPYYRRFLDRFPDLAALAAASEREVITVWAGLGYYSRPRNMLRAAALVAKEFNGSFPEDFESLIRLPGVGRYTAGAISSIAFGQRQPVVDGNVRRVIRRLRALDGTTPDRFFWEQADAWVPRRQPGEFNQAAMELGAVVCTPSNPGCPSCPVRSLCRSYRRLGSNRPRGRKTTPPVDVSLVILVIESPGKLLLSCRGGPDFIPGPYRLPTGRVSGGSPSDTVDDLARAVLGRALETHPVKQIRHRITNRRILAYVYHAETIMEPGSLTRTDLLWVDRTELDHALTSSLYLKVVRSMPAPSGTGA
jgi:A/G-specific adenine glycosylase